MHGVFDASFFCVSAAIGKSEATPGGKRVSQGRANQAVLLLLAILGGLYFLLALHPIWDVDVFWHIRAGQWMVENLSLPSTDIFSAVDPERTWVPFQWLYEVLCFAADEAGGLFLVRLMHAVVAAAGVIAAGLSLGEVRSSRSGEDAGEAGAAGQRRAPWLAPVVAVLAAFLFADRLRARPDVFNLLLFWLLLAVLREWRWSRGRIVAVLVLSAAWANLHAGGALLAPVLLAARFAGRAGTQWAAGVGAKKVDWREIGRGARSDLLVLGLTCGVMCLMPGFVRGVYQAFFMLGPSKRFIPEWMSSVEFLLEHAVVAHELLAGGLAVAALPLLALQVGWRLVRQRDGEGLLDLAMAAPLALLSLLHVRFLWLGAPVLGMWLVRLDGTSSRGDGRWATAVRWGIRGLAAVAAAGLLGLDVHYHVGRNAGGLDRAMAGIGIDLEPGYFPEEAADALARAGVTGRVWNHAPWGGYLLYELWPGCTVATDGRGNFGELEASLLAATDSVSRRGGAIARAVEEIPFDLVVHPNPFPYWEASPERVLWVYHDDHARVYLRTDPDNRDNVLRMARVAGVEIGQLPEPGDREGWGEVQRRLVRQWAVRRLFSAPHAQRVETLRSRLDGGSVDAARELALVYFDLGLFAECRQVLEAEEEVTAIDTALLVMAWWADGRFEEAAGSCRVLNRRLQAGESLPPRAQAVVAAICSREGAY